jgi:hypothetical protein
VTRGPLSFGQEVLWLLDRTAPGTVAYNVPRALRVKGALDLLALERAFARVVARHGVLRTRFVEGADGPEQVEEAGCEFRLEQHDLADRRPEAIDAWLRERAREPFDLGRAPQMRVCVAALAPDDHVLLVLMHHIVTDGWSKGLLWQELAEGYAAECAGEAPSAGPASSFLAVARRQREDAAAGRFADDLAYWTAQLDGAPLRLDLPTDRPRTAQASFDGARLIRTPAAETVAAVAALASRHRATPFMVWLAGWQALLGRYSGSSDVVTGTPVSGRDDPDVAGVMGNFTNMVTVRSRFDDTATFATLLASVRDTMLDALEHQAIPIEQVEAALASARQGAPLFTTMFLLEREDRRGFSLGHATATPLIFETGWTKAELTLALVQGEGGVLLSLQYRSDLLLAATAERMLGHLERLLVEAAARPEAPLAALTILTPGERRLVVEEWNRTARPYPAGETLLELLHAQAERTPDAIAVESGAEALTFAALRIRAATLGRWLAGEGVGPGVLVGVCLERSIDMVVALLGVLEAGGAYVPMDPDYPAERLAFMLADADVPVLLTQAALR